MNFSVANHPVRCTPIFQIETWLRFTKSTYAGFDVAVKVLLKHSGSEHVMISTSAASGQTVWVLARAKLV